MWARWGQFVISIVLCLLAYGEIALKSWFSQAFGVHIKGCDSDPFRAVFSSTWVSWDAQNTAKQGKRKMTNRPCLSRTGFRNESAHESSQEHESTRNSAHEGVHKSAHFPARKRPTKVSALPDFTCLVVTCSVSRQASRGNKRDKLKGTNGAKFAVFRFR